MSSPVMAHPARPVIGLLLLLLTAPSGVGASNPLSWFLHKDVDVLSVTDVTDAGRAYAPATPQQPVYYKIIDLGQEDFGRTWAGEKLPHFRTVRAWLMKALERQGYLLADEQHPPTQLLVFSWGMTNQGAFQFMGGDRMPPPVPGWFAPPTGIWAKVVALSSDDVFLGLVKSFTLESENGPETTLLWQTRFGCAANGLSFKESMPLMIEAAAANFGRETKIPVNVNATDAFGGRVEFGEFKVLGESGFLPPPAAEQSPETPPTATEK